MTTLRARDRVGGQSRYTVNKALIAGGVPGVQHGAVACAPRTKSTSRPAAVADCGAGVPPGPRSVSWKPALEKATCDCAEHRAPQRKPGEGCRRRGMAVGSRTAAWPPCELVPSS